MIQYQSMRTRDGDVLSRSRMLVVAYCGSRKGALMAGMNKVTAVLLAEGILWLPLPAITVIALDKFCHLLLR